MNPNVTDAWQQLQDLHNQFTKEILVRKDIRVRGLALDRSVELGLGHEEKGVLPTTKFMRFETTQRNISTMRELANAILDACDFVEGCNPQWAAQPKPSPWTIP